MLPRGWVAGRGLRERDAATLVAAPSHLGEWARRDEEPATGLTAPAAEGLMPDEKQETDPSKFTERSWNVYENKGQQYS